MEPIIPRDVGLFILKRIDSIAQLEAVLLLRQSPDTWWECKEVADRLYIPEKNCAPILAGLCGQGLLVCVNEQTKPVYRYRPDTGDLREMVDRLAYYYSKHLVPVSNLVHAKARTRIEGFARAFDLTSEE
ncbi:hypothetical protein [Candidatus Nitrospira nitrificans]|uniref:Transcriptional regulator n=1 Tax=Candidatus Nitrospira nitrificans TaxID=1742973 RepID=A0A0S4LQA7_9BACT|nr:hypothetical protein [Candidatus Nitrospira nitrificans]CUS39134.1 conserved hypothetical protein [Candidatus Nitrospira nitrificans]